MNKLNNVQTIHLGDELLMGLRLNTHLEYLGEKFAGFGIDIKRSFVIRDQLEEINRSLEIAWEEADLIIVTGGLGPTEDDKTRDAVADFLNLKLIYVEEIEQMIRERFRLGGYVFSDNNLRQCYALEGAEVLENPHGTAPGQWIEKEGKLVILLPGPPRELNPMFEEKVIPLLIEKGWMEGHIPHIQLRTVGIGESKLETSIQPLLKANPEVQVAYCAHASSVDVRFVVNDPVHEETLKKVSFEAEKIFGEDFVGYGNDELAEWLLKALIDEGSTLSVAESCTGGLIAAELTEIPGASKAFMGGMITYSDESKIRGLGVPEKLIEDHGVVSDQVARAMAKGVGENFSTTYGLSITGYAGPDGGTEKDPVGTVYIGFHSPKETMVKKVNLRGDRKAVRERAVVQALDLVRRNIRKYDNKDKTGSD